MKKVFVVVVSAVAVLAMGCGPLNPKYAKLPIDSEHCYPPIYYTYDTTSRPILNIAQVLGGDTLSFKKRYSQHSLMVANATGVLKDLRELRADSMPNSSTAELKRHKIITQLFLVSTEIASVAAELDCEGERANQVADFLTEKETKQVRLLTILSVTTGAMASVGNAFKQASAAEAFTIIGGSISAALGIGALFSHRKVAFQHPRNLLADIWRQPRHSTLFPAPIWYMLTEKYFSNAQEYSIAHNMRERWIKFEELDIKRKRSQKEIRLLFGVGGNYSADELRARARMVNQVQAAVKLMNQDLEGLIMEMSK
jgi:hypothetical protein